MVAPRYTVGALCLLQLGCGSGENVGSTGTPGQQAPPAGQPAPQAPQLLSIAGRWGMFHFEDPVAVDIVQDGTNLTGLGCDAGLPSATTDRIVRDQCSALHGAISGDSAWFEFRYPLFDGIIFRAEVTASRDSKRMAGSFTDAAGQLLLTSWLRLREDERFLQRLEGLNDPLRGEYALTLIAAESPGTSFDAGKTYKLFYAPGLGVYGELGAFYYTELTRSGDSAPIQLGPVPATGQALPVQIQLDHDTAALTRITAVNASGIASVFTAARTH